MSATDADRQLGGRELTSTERRLVHAAAVGGLVDLRAGDTAGDDPIHGGAWGAERTIRADLLAELLTGQRTPEGRRRQPVRLRGGKVTGALMLEGADLASPLLLADCYFDTPVNLRQAAAPAIRMPGCCLPGLAADQLRTSGDLELSRGFAADGEISLAGASIGGVLELGGATLVNPGGYVLWAPGLSVAQDMNCEELAAEGEIRLQGAQVGGNVSFFGATLANPGGFAVRAAALVVGQTLLFSHGFTAKGEIRIPGARIGAVLSLAGATLVNPDGRALHADGITVGQSVYGQDAEGGGTLSATGEVSIIGARIEGQLNLDAAHLSNRGGLALSALNLDVKQGMWCRGGFVAEGEISLTNARIGGRASFSGARLSNPGGCALRADGLTVEEGLSGRDGFTAEGGIVLRGARIGGTVDLEEGRLSAPGADALSAARLTVGHDMFCRGLNVEGETRLPGARIGGTLVLARAHLANSGGRALHAERLTVADDMSCTDGFTATGEVRLYGARVGGLIDLSDALLSHPGGQALDLYAATAAELHLLPRRAPDGVVNLTNAKVGVFADEQSTWAATVLLRGFTYDSLHDDRADVRARLRWLARDPGGYAPEIYDQLAATYRRAGREDAARRVAIAKLQRRRSVLGPAGKLLDWLLYATVGYGYRTWLAGAWLVLLAALGTSVFSRVRMLPAIEHPAPFHPLGYTLDLLLPIVNLGQATDWQSPGGVLYLSWALIGAGWVLTTAVVAALTGITKRD